MPITPGGAHALRRSRILLQRSAVLLTSVFVLVAPVEASGQDPMEQLKMSIDNVIDILQNPALQAKSKAQERRSRIRSVADQIYDFGEMARRALARHWRPLTDEQRREFVRLFRELVEESYIARIELYSGEPIRYTGATREGEFATVSTSIITKNGTEVPIDHRMLKRGDRWYVYDIRIEEVSLVSNYRTQFNAVIQSSSYATLVHKMRHRVEVLRKES